MNTKTMEGLIGAGANIDLVNTPIRVYKEARRKGDLTTMERSMGYAGEFAVNAEEYRAQADEGTQEEAKENREKMELEREEAIRKRREEREQPKEETADTDKNPIDDIIDTLEVSETGRILSENQTILPENAGYSGNANPAAQN